MDIRWNAHLYPKNTDFVEVVVDLTKLASQAYLDRLTFIVSLFDTKSRLLEKKSFFTPETFEAGKVNIIYFALERKGVASAVGDELRYDFLGPGLRFIMGPEEPGLKAKEAKMVTVAIEPTADLSFEHGDAKYINHPGG